MWNAVSNGMVSPPPTAATPRIEGEYLESEYLGSTLLGK